MGLLEALHGKRVYFDANIFIYHLENEPTYAPLIGNALQALALGEFTAITSHLTLTEILPPLVRANKPNVIQKGIEFISEAGLFDAYSANDRVFIQAGFLRGTLGMKTPDAIHVATAILHEADVFLTNDQGIRVPDTIQRLVLKDFV